jgi:amidase
MAIKDMAATAGIRTTLGSPLLAHNVPTFDNFMVARMKGAGGIVIGKTNTPEFGLGSHTYNTVFGVTRNAWDPSRTAGGSSGGAAVSLALRMQPVADGSDFMGSLRNPAAYNNVFGFRPSPGRVPAGPIGDQFVSQLGTEGPMGRSVRDVAMLFSVQAGRHPRTPLSVAESGAPFAAPFGDLPRGLKVGWLGDLSGYLPMEPGIFAACEAGLAKLASLGCDVEPATLGFAPERVWAMWLTWRRWLVSGRVAPYFANPVQRAQLKPEARWEAEQGAGLSAADTYAASLERSAFYAHIMDLYDRYDFLVLPGAQSGPSRGVLADGDQRPPDGHVPPLDGGRDLCDAGWPSRHQRAGGLQRRGAADGLQLMGQPPTGASAQLAAAYEMTIGDGWRAAANPPGRLVSRLAVISLLRLTFAAPQHSVPAGRPILISARLPACKPPKRETAPASWLR